VIDARVTSKSDAGMLRSSRISTQGQEFLRETVEDEEPEEDAESVDEEDDEDDKEIKNVLHMLRQQDGKQSKPKKKSGKGKKQEQQTENEKGGERENDGEDEVVLILKTVMTRRDDEGGGWVGPEFPLIERLFVDMFEENRREENGGGGEGQGVGTSATPKKGKKQTAKKIVNEMLSRGYSNAQRKKSEEMWAASQGQEDTFFRIPGCYMVSFTLPFSLSLILIHMQVYDWTMPLTQGLSIPSDWQHVLDEVIATAAHRTDEMETRPEGHTGGGSPPSLLICGAKNVGKSTFAKFAINSLLTRYNNRVLLS